MGSPVSPAAQRVHDLLFREESGRERGLEKGDFFQGSSGDTRGPHAASVAPAAPRARSIAQPLLELGSERDAQGRARPPPAQDVAETADSRSQAQDATDDKRDAHAAGAAPSDPHARPTVLTPLDLGPEPDARSRARHPLALGAAETGGPPSSARAPFSPPLRSNLVRAPPFPPNFQVDNAPLSPSALLLIVALAHAGAQDVSRREKTRDAPNDETRGGAIDPTPLLPAPAPGKGGAGSNEAYDFARDAREERADLAKLPAERAPPAPHDDHPADGIAAEANGAPAIRDDFFHSPLLPAAAPKQKRGKSSDGHDVTRDVRAECAEDVERPAARASPAGIPSDERAAAAAPTRRARPRPPGTPDSASSPTSSETSPSGGAHARKAARRSDTPPSAPDGPPGDRDKIDHRHVPLAPPLPPPPLHQQAAPNPTTPRAHPPNPPGAGARRDRAAGFGRPLTASAAARLPVFFTDEMNAELDAMMTPVRLLPQEAIGAQSPPRARAVGTRAQNDTARPSPPPALPPPHPTPARSPPSPPPPPAEARTPSRLSAGA
jgi:hypothetical protein